MRLTLMLLLGAALSAHAAFGQGEPGADAIAGLKTANKERNDSDRIHFGKILVEAWPNIDAKLRPDGLKEMQIAMIRAREDATRLGIAEMIGSLGGGEKDRDSEAATRVLTDQFKDAEKNLTYLNALMLSVGKLGTAKGAEALMKMLKFKDYDAIASAVVSLGQYQEADLELKKTIVGELLKVYSGVASQARDQRNSVAQERFAKLQPPLESSLKRLTKVSDVSGVLDWTSWWNNTGKRAKEW